MSRKKKYVFFFGSVLLPMLDKIYLYKQCKTTAGVSNIREFLCVCLWSEFVQQTKQCLRLSGFEKQKKNTHGLCLSSESACELPR